jgi:hypothetical protein
MFLVCPEGKPLDVGGAGAEAWVQPRIDQGPSGGAEGDWEMGPFEGRAG